MARAESLGEQVLRGSSSYHVAKREMSEVLLGVPRRGRKIQMVKRDPAQVANLVGVGVAEKRTERKGCGVPAVTFYVERKLPRSMLTRRLLLPRSIGGLVCDVVACGRISPAAGGPAWTPLDPVVPGAQISIGGLNPGTLGAFVRDTDGEVCFLSNCHVLSRDLATGSDTPVFQPGTSFAGSRQIGTVKRVVPIYADRRNTVDVALARLDGNIHYDPGFSELGGLNGVLPEPQEFDDVVKFGAATGRTRGDLDSIETDLRVPFQFMTATFSRVSVFRPSSFADEGDSGSLVLVRRSVKAVGLVFAVSPLLAFAIPCSAISDALPGIEWL